MTTPERIAGNRAAVISTAIPATMLATSTTVAVSAAVVASRLSRATEHESGDSTQSSFRNNAAHVNLQRR